jgi:hypothetical protein
VWEWADDNASRDGHVASVTVVTVDSLVNVTGFGAAMANVAGWLLADDSGIYFPNYDRHNGKPAKERALAAERKRKQREREEEVSRNGHG